MTPDERAEKIKDLMGCTYGFDKYTPLIAAEIRQAEEEVAAQNKFCADAMELAKSQGKAEAYEDASKIARDFRWSDGEETSEGIAIGTLIRARIRQETKEIRYSGQCFHGQPMGQACEKCDRAKEMK